MDNLRRYGVAPFAVAVIHGGPGAPGTMAPVARELSTICGVLEPLQTAASLEGQVQELRAVLEANAELPVTLIGSSWGAMLAFIVAARYPELARKLIMIGSGVFEERYAAMIDATRMGRLIGPERREVEALAAALADPAVPDKDAPLVRLGQIFTRIDAYDPLTLDTEVIKVQFEVHQTVWREARALRISGEFLELGRRITCPVVAIHGDYDPHPAAGIREPLSTVLADFGFILLERCGHLPWIECQARDVFYRILKAELV